MSVERKGIYMHGKLLSVKQEYIASYDQGCLAGDEEDTLTPENAVELFQHTGVSLSNHIPPHNHDNIRSLGK
jgi:hypothetical protein